MRHVRPRHRTALKAPFQTAIGFMVALGMLLAVGGNAAAAPCLERFALYSTEATLLRDRVFVESGNTGSNGSIELGSDGVSLEDFVAGGDILLRDRATVYGDATASGTVSLQSGAQVVQSIEQGALLSPCEIPTANVTPGGENINVWSGQSIALEPGEYGEVRVYSNARLDLRAGLYQFALLRTEADANLGLDVEAGNLEIQVSTSLSFGDRTRWMFSGNEQPEKLKFHSQQTSTLFVGTDISFLGTLQAPLAPIKVYSRTVFEGAVYGRSLDFEPDVIVVHVPFAEPVVELPANYPPTYIPGQTTYLEACEQALSELSLPEEPAWLDGCTTAVFQDEVRTEVTFQIPGRDLGSHPPQVASMGLLPITPPGPEGNATLEVVFAEALPDEVNFVWNEEIYTLRDDGLGADPVALDGVYNVFLEVAPGAFAQPAPPPPSPALAEDCGPPEAPTCELHPEKVLMIRDLSVVEDSVRTQDPCLSTDPADAQKVWTFGYLMSHMVSPEQIQASGGDVMLAASNFAESWLENWNSTVSVNDWDLSPLSSGEDELGEVTLPRRLLETWQAHSSVYPLDMNKAPFRLLSIVNRFDLRESNMFSSKGGGELRFIFAPLNLATEESDPGSACEQMGFPVNLEPDALHTVILEYAVDLNPNDVFDWAEQWRLLDEKPFDSPEYRQQLEAITQSVVTMGRGAAFPGGPNGEPRANNSALAQIRTNETDRNVSWDLREFIIDEQTDVLVPTTVKLTPDASYDDSYVLGSWIAQNWDDIVNPNTPYPELDATFPLPYTPFLGAHILNDTNGAGFWQPKPNWSDYTDHESRQARHVFSLNTCNGCHGTETADPNGGVFFAHVMPREYGVPSRLSSFLTGLPMDPSAPQYPVYVPDPVVARSTALHSVTWTGSQLVTVGDAGTIQTSPTGSSLTDRDSGTSNTLRSVIWTGTQLVAVGDGGSVTRSPDGVNWSHLAIGDGEALNSVAWHGTGLAMVGNRGTILTTEGEDERWSAQVSGTERSLYDVVSNGTLLVAVGQNGTILTSEDRVTWEQQSAGTAETLSSVTWTGNEFVAVGDGATVVTSNSDGTSWTSETLANLPWSTLNSVAWTGDELVVVGLNGVTLTGDGAGWVVADSGTSTSLNAVTFTGQSGFELAAVGPNNTFFTSPDVGTSPWLLGSSSGPSSPPYPAPEGLDIRQRHFNDLLLRRQILADFLLAGPLTSPATPAASPAVMSFQPSGRTH